MANHITNMGGDHHAALSQLDTILDQMRAEVKRNRRPYVASILKTDHVSALHLCLFPEVEAGQSVPAKAPSEWRALQAGNITIHIHAEAEVIDLASRALHGALEAGQATDWGRKAPPEPARPDWAIILPGQPIFSGDEFQSTNGIWIVVGHSQVGENVQPGEVVRRRVSRADGAEQGVALANLGATIQKQMVENAKAIEQVVTDKHRTAVDEIKARHDAELSKGVRPFPTPPQWANNPAQAVDTPADVGSNPPQPPVAPRPDHAGHSGPPQRRGG